MKINFFFFFIHFILNVVKAESVEWGLAKRVRIPLRYIEVRRYCRVRYEGLCQEVPQRQVTARAVVATLTGSHQLLLYLNLDHFFLFFNYSFSQ